MSAVCRPLLDFLRIMESFENHGFSFVSVTQQFNTTSSMGRLTLNILLSFAQFERGIISERTRDKTGAARHKGRYIGGPPILGYDVDRVARRLVVNEAEAIRARQFFQLYLEYQALIPTIVELDRRGWTTKRWTTKKGKQHGGNAFTKNSLYGLLTNVTYVASVTYKAEVFDGQNEAIVDAGRFELVQKQLQLNHRTGKARVRNRFGALLKGLIRCGPCGCAMAPSHTTKNGTKRYRYYVCINAQKRGWQNCPSRSIPAPEVEAFVDQVRTVAGDPALVSATLKQASKKVHETLGVLDEEREAVERELARTTDDLRNLALDASRAGDNSLEPSRLAGAQERLRLGEVRLTEIREETIRLQAETITEDDVATALDDFAVVWEALSTREKMRILNLLIAQVEYDGNESTVSVMFRPCGIKALAEESAA